MTVFSKSWWSWSNCYTQSKCTLMCAWDRLCVCVYTPSPNSKISLCVNRDMRLHQQNEEMHQQSLQQCQETQSEWHLIPGVVCFTIKINLSHRHSSSHIVTPTHFIFTVLHKQTSPLLSFHSYSIDISWEWENILLMPHCPYNQASLSILSEGLKCL